ncbi:MAG: hypothetical protein ACREJ3_04360, partial [Polyangiaceae bacterium]
MADRIEELVQRWRRSPDAGTTLALCGALSEPEGEPFGDLAHEVGQDAAARHPADATVLSAAGRMYLYVGRLADAQTMMVAAGRLAPHDGEIYRWLGETLLRRGDAQRATRVLTRALQLGGADDETPDWLERARALRPMQVAAGTRAVAAEVAQALLPPRDFLDSVTERTTDIQQNPLVPQRQTDGLSPKAPAASAPESRAPSPPPPARPALAHGSPALPSPARPVLAHGSPALPYPRDVMDALALAGLFEPPGKTVSGAAAAWDVAPKRPKRKGTWTILGGMVVFLAGSVGTYFFYRHKRAFDHHEAEAILANVEDKLAAAKPSDLPEIEQEIGQAFKLESRSPRAALDWTRE